MCNCGNKRNALVIQSYKAESEANAHTPSNRLWADINFKYMGQTALTVTGRVTGRRYRFSHTGDVQLIDYRDAGELMAVPVLKKL